MTTPMYQLMLREYVSKAEEKYNIYSFFGWNVEWVVQYRNGLLKLLLKDQLKNFDRS